MKFSKYEYIAFIDADCVAPTDWLEILTDEFKTAKHLDNKVVATGGANLPPEESDKFLKALNLAQDSYLGSFNSAQGRKFKERRYVPSLANLNVLYLKSAIIEVGNYDESLASDAEDADMNFRLKKAGWRFVFVPRSFVWHRFRPDASRWFKNMFRYGRGRARLLKRYPDMWSISYALPIVFAFAMISIPFSVISPYFILSMTYFPMIIVFSLVLCLYKGSVSLLFQVIAIFLIQHFGYAAGELYGLINPKVK